MGNIKCYHKIVFTICLFKQTKQNKTVVKNHESLIYLVGGKTANHVNFMQHMLVSTHHAIFSSLEGNIAEVSKILTSGN